MNLCNVIIVKDQFSKVGYRENGNVQKWQKSIKK